MKFYVYALVNPEHPEQHVYYGSTSQPPKKRLSDHVSEVKFKVKHGTRLTHKMEWIASLLLCGLRPQMVVLQKYRTEEAATAAEQRMIDANPMCLNVQRAGGGRPVGSKDSPEACRKKQLAAIERYKDLDTPAFNRAFDDRWLVSQLYRAGRRMEMGFPDPHLGARYSLPNRRHFRELLRADPNFKIEPVHAYKERFCHVG